MSKKISTLILLAALYCGNAFAQSCVWTTSNYDLVVMGTTTFGPISSSTYTQGFVCNGGVLTDSLTCCTRFVVVDNGGSMIVGPNSYGTAYVMDGATFNGQGASNNWMVVAEPTAVLLNHTGSVQQCSTIVYSPTSCSMGLSDNKYAKPTVTLNASSLNFEFSAVMNDARIELVDVNGKVVKSEMMNQSSVHAMDVSGIASGVYMYRVMWGAELISSDKLVISE